MWWKASPQDLHRISDRVSTVYVERCHIDREDNAVVVVNKQRTVRLPAALVGAVLLGPGTRITHAATALLGDSGTTICWVGDKGVRFYASGLGPSRGSQLLLRQAHLVTRVKERLAVARAMYAIRFPDEDVSDATMQQLRGKEGARVKKLYKEHAERTGVKWSGRVYKAGDAFAAGDNVNRSLSALNAALYGACHAAIVGVGASPALGFVHTGTAISFVLDIADLYKAEYTIPLAFDLVKESRVGESEARYALRERFADGKFMQNVVRDVISLLGDGTKPSVSDTNELWDEKLGTVDGGTNWSDDAIEELLSNGFLSLSGPELPESATKSATSS